MTNPEQSEEVKVVFRIDLVTVITKIGVVGIGNHTTITDELSFDMRLRLSIDDGALITEAEQPSDLISAFRSYLLEQYDYELTDDKAVQVLEFLMSNLEEGKDFCKVQVTIPAQAEH